MPLTAIEMVMIISKHMRCAIVCTRIEMRGHEVIRHFAVG